MRIRQLLLLLLVFISSQVNAQTYKIDTTEITFEKKLRPCLAVKYDAPPKTVKKAWDDFFRKYYQVKIAGISLVANKEIITGTDVTIAAVSDKRMDLHASIIDVAGGSGLTYFMSFGYDFFIGPKDYPTEFAAMKKILNDFSMEFLNDYYGSKASDIIKKIKGLEKDITKNDKTVKKNISKSNKSSAAVASGLEAKNTSLNMENDQWRNKITELTEQIADIKLKQAGITRN